MGYKIRRMTLLDAEQVAAIEAAVFSHPWSLADFQNEMNNNLVARYLVAVENQKIIGFAGAHVIFDEGHITNVAVLPKEQKRGIGKALMTSLMQYTANLGVRYLTLEVRASNKSAIHLYRSFGFLKLSVRKKYYEDNREDAWLMVSDKMPPADESFMEEETAVE